MVQYRNLGLPTGYHGKDFPNCPYFRILYHVEPQLPVAGCRIFLTHVELSYPPEVLRDSQTRRRLAGDNLGEHKAGICGF